jgi:hypothetical protein
VEVSGQFHPLAALLQGKGPLYPLDMRLGGPQSRRDRGVEKIPISAGNRTLVAQPLASIPADNNIGPTRMKIKFSRQFDVQISNTKFN